MSARACTAVATTLVLGAASLVARPAAAQSIPERFTLHIEGGLGGMLSTAQRDAGYDLAMDLGARVGFELFDPFSIQLAASTWSFPVAGAPQNGGVGLLGAGVRFEPRVGPVGRLFVDGDVGAALSGPPATGATTSGPLQSRTMIDLGFGFEFTPTRWFGVGPVLRYGRVVAQEGIDMPSDAQFWSIGVTLSVRLPRAEPPHPAAVADAAAAAAQTAAATAAPPPDGDHDGVPDHDDFCANDPAGAHPDPARPGCPLPDADHDGLPDATDACPTEAPGEHPDPARAGCPDADDDHDGVPNHGDACPTEPAGTNPDPARAGCPAPDADHDGVTDATDACPALPGSASAAGCPAIGTRASDGALLLTQPIVFAPGTARLLPRSDAALTPLAELLRTATAARTVAVEAHTDEGGAARAQALSQQRAEAVVAWLTAHGVEASRLEAHGYGATRPLAQGTTPQVRAQNRRVEFRVTAPAGGGS